MNQSHRTTDTSPSIVCVSMSLCLLCHSTQFDYVLCFFALLFATEFVMRKKASTSKSADRLLHRRQKLEKLASDDVAFICFY